CRATLIWRCSSSICAVVDVRAPWEGVATTTRFSAPGSFASTLLKSAFAGPPLPHHCSPPNRPSWLTSKCGCASTAGRPIPPSSSMPATPRALDGGPRERFRKVGTGRHSQLFPGPREPLRQGNRREADDQPAVSRCQRPLPSRSRRCCSRLCPLAACRLAAVSGGGASEPADRGMRWRSRRAPHGEFLLPKKPMIRPQTADLMTCATTCTERLRGQEMFLFLNAPPH